MTERLVIIGGGGLSREVIELVFDLNAADEQWNLLGVLDDDVTTAPQIARHGVRRLGPVADFERYGAPYVIAVGSPAARRSIAERIRSLGVPAASLVHPTAAVGRFVDAGEGLLVAANASVTTDVRMGRHVHVNLNVTVGHDVVMGDYVSVNPGAVISGNVRLGDGVMVGTGAAIIQGVSVGAGTTIGAGAVVVDDLPDGVVAVGVPARPK